MILAPEPVVLEQRQIEIERSARRAGLRTQASRARGKRNRRQTRGRAQSLLRAAVTGVRAPSPDIDRVRAKRRDRIHDCQRAVPLRDRADLGHGIQHPRRRLGVHHRDDVGAVGVERAFDQRRVARAPPFDVHARHRRAVALEHLRQPITEIAGDHDERARTRPREIGDRSLHPRRARAGDRERQRVRPGLERHGEPRANAVENRHHVAVEMAENRRRHRAHDTRGDRAGPGTKKQTFS